MIDRYESGRSIQINGETFHHDVKIIGDVVVGNWWRKQGHRLHIDDIEDILDFRPEVLVIGTGYAGQMQVPSATRTALKGADIGVEADETSRAVQNFNRLLGTGCKVAGAFHLTC
jgi:hypothetical protein